MASANINQTSISLENKADLIEAISSGEKPKEQWRIGSEHEKFVFYKNNLAPVPYEGEAGIKRLLEGMEGLLGWKRMEDKGNIIGLIDPIEGGAISLEPGGQFELSGAPLETLHQTCREVHGHLAQLREVADPLGIGFLGLGTSPKWSLEETPVMPKSRYGIMMNYMPKVGTRGLDMMFRSCTIQVNLDFASEADMAKKMRVGLALQPIATALFANSPFLDGQKNGYQSLRGAIWQDLDEDRTGMLPFVFDENFGYEQYVDWALDVPMYFIIRDGTYYDMTGVTFRDYLNGKRMQDTPDTLPSMQDWEDHLTTLFPEVRLKRYIEMRGADGGQWRRICALPALWTGLLYDQTTLDAAWDLVKDWTEEERNALRIGVAKDGLRTPFRGDNVQAIARRVVELSRNGLAARGQKNGAGFDETQYLAALEETVALGMTPSDMLLSRYCNEWGGNIDRVFEDFAY
ncbi:glutamate--cysteine ligase [Cohaesibacter gelatinilyticus]|uniref:Glutamate--cysteine ligase n=1 Tax=Cohaesibacter gelatinilyticus TaxID=372072 RepID=A0A285N9L9_9HYPH|nr:glutamate--cysteine ligase [Cohaesibacter gelatinilyticus]SNZ05603.1 glutamate--cysteine ligase [Cohaesibacter gelatinilyticus]